MIYLYLKSLEANGFKSFAEKVTVSFKSGVIAVVGPNGSGKSNITDAIRWVLGEQSTRYLRASAMQDIIFSGTQARKAANLAQVSLVFDNTDHSLPVDYQEVEITRRLYRNGESEYYINKKACRLKDVHNLFLDTGVGKGSLFVIGQNKVDEILNGRADEKRVLIEDIAGIIKYKLKKQESLQRLDKIQENLLRICDIKIEYENNIQNLEVEAGKTAKYNELYELLKANSIQEYLFRYAGFQKNIEELEQKCQLEIVNKAKNNADIAALEENQAVNNTSLEKLDMQYTQMQATLTNLATNCEKISGHGKLLRERQQQLKSKINELDANQEKLITDYNRQVKINLTNLQKDKAYKQQELENLTILYEKVAEEYQKINISYLEKTKAYKHLQEELNIGINEYLDKKNQGLYLQKNLEQIKLRIHKSTTELSECEKSLEILTASLQEQKNILFKQQQQQSMLRQTVTQKLQNKELLKQENSLKSEQLDKIGQQIQKIVNQNIILERLHASYQGFASGTRSVLAAKTSWRQGVIGAVVEVLKVPKEYITALETALGSSMQNIITKDDNIAKQAVQYLKDNKAGRVTFLPLNTIKEQKLSDSKILQELGVVGTAASLVNCRAELQVVASFLLERIIVVDNIENALKIAKKYNFRYRLVTLAGEVLNVGGSLTGGSLKNNEPSFLAREEELKNNKTKLIELKNQQSILQEAVVSIVQKLQDLDVILAKKMDEAQKLEISGSKQQTQIEYLIEKKQVLEKDCKIIKTELVQATNELVETEQLIQSTEKLVTALENSKHSGKDDLSQYEQEIERLQTERESKLKAVNELEINQNALKQEIKYIDEKILYTQEDIEAIVVERKKIIGLIKENQSLEDKLLQEIIEIDKQQQQAEVEIAEQKRANAAIALKRESLLSEQINIQSALREKNLAQSNLERSVSKAEANLAEKKLQIENLQANLQEKFAVDLKQVENLQDENINIKECRKTIQLLQDELVKLGVINPKAIEDYNAAVEKLDFMQKQYQDLLESKENLDIIIRDIDKEMVERFKKAFKELNVEFAKTYKNLFSGGSARLELLQADDWLNSGVEIYVQPVGKKQQALSLLSGGERSLTVIALLFAILSMRKTSFCVLDEIDAPLDEANLHRFNRYLQEFGTNTQFIIVTHRKPSMQIANTIYGVTMQEPGVSKVLSVQIKDVEEKE